jgi:uncharacterized membrane protein HdeD (DUF308 family)
MLGTLPLVGGAFAVAVVFMYRYMNSTGSDGIDDSMVVALALGTIICLVGAALCFGGIVAVLLSLSRARRDAGGPW